MRRLRLKSAALLHWLLHLHVTILEALMASMAPKVVKHGILLVDPNHDTRAEFFNTIDAALNIIERTDPLIHKRVTNQIKRIYHLPSPNGADYTRPLKICSVDVKKLASVDQDNPLSDFIACALVHEATHGYLYSQGIYFQSGTNIRRVERLCCKAMNTFLRKRGSEGFPWLEDADYAPKTLKQIFGWLKHILLKIHKDEW